MIEFNYMRWLSVLKIFKNDDKEKINYEKLNEIIKILNVMLKIVFVLVIVLVLYVSTKVLAEWGVFNFISNILTVISPLFIGIFIAWLLNPIVNKLNKKGVNRVLGTIFTYIVFLVIVYLIMSSLIPILADEINSFVKSVPSYLDSLKGYTDNIFDKLSSPNFDITSTKLDFYKQIETLVTDFTAKLPATLVNTIKTFFSTLWSFVIGMIIGLYLLFDFDNSIKKIISFIPKKYQRTIDDICSRMDTTLKNFVQGTIIDASIIFFSCAIGFWFAGLKAPLLFALFCAVTNIIPYIGPYIGATPAVLVGYAQGPLVGTVVLIVNIVIQGIEGNFIQPLVMSKTMKLHPVTIIVGLLVFGYFFGILGMIISTPIISLVKVLFVFINEKYKLIEIEE